MPINNISLSNFRNFDSIHLNTEKLNIIFGPNASGKTNLLEGIFILLNGHSLKRKNTNLQKNSEEKTSLSCTAVKTDNIFIEINNGIKTLKLNSKKTKIMELKTKFPSVVYSIDSFLYFKNKDYLFSLLDRNSFIENKKVAESILEYKKLVKIKKKLLSQTRIDEKMFMITNDKLIKVMDDISDKRIESVEYLNSSINNILKEFTKKRVEFNYIKNRIARENVKYEIYKRRLITSLNLDKIEIMLDNKNIFKYSSVGEKKIVLLSLIIVIIQHYNKKGETPVLLIDDLEGDLDNNLKQTAFEMLISLPNQLFLTTLGEYLYNKGNIIRL